MQVCLFRRERVFGARRKVKTENSLNNKPFFLNERLIKFEAELRAGANRQGLITPTKKCSLFVLVKRKDTVYHNINQISDLQNVKNPIKRDNHKKKYCHDDDNKVDDDREVTGLQKIFIFER